MIETLIPGCDEIPEGVTFVQHARRRTMKTKPDLCFIHVVENPGEPVRYEACDGHRIAIWENGKKCEGKEPQDNYIMLHVQDEWDEGQMEIKFPPLQKIISSAGWPNSVQITDVAALQSLLWRSIHEAGVARSIDDNGEWASSNFEDFCSFAVGLSFPAKGMGLRTELGEVHGLVATEALSVLVESHAAFALKPMYLLDALSAFGGQPVKISWDDKLDRPIRIDAVNGGQGFCLIMRMRVEWL